MKVLILGGTGMAGHTISIFFKEIGHDVTAFCRREIDYCKYIIGDITNFKRLETIINEGQFDAIINAVGILNQEADDLKSHAVMLNSYLPHFLSETTRKMKTKIIHMSTDCVFSGKTGSYSESSFKDGETFYDRSKALGELENNKDITFRNSIIGPDTNESGIGLFNWFMRQENKVDGFTEAVWTGVTTLTLAKAMDQALKENLVGVYHLVNNQTINKYELLKLLSRNFRYSQIEIIPNNNVVVDKSLINNRTDFSFKVPSYETMVTEMKEWIVNHKSLYPHYFKTEEEDI